MELKFVKTINTIPTISSKSYQSGIEILRLLMSRTLCRFSKSYQSGIEIVIYRFEQGNAVRSKSYQSGIEIHLTVSYGLY